MEPPETTSLSPRCTRGEEEARTDRDRTHDTDGPTRDHIGRPVDSELEAREPDRDRHGEHGDDHEMLLPAWPDGNDAWNTSADAIAIGGRVRPTRAFSTTIVTIEVHSDSIGMAASTIVAPINHRTTAAATATEMRTAASPARVTVDAR
jgi:hypothetical protein